MFDRKLVAYCLPLDLNLFSGRHWYTIKRDSGKFDDFLTNKNINQNLQSSLAHHFLLLLPTGDLSGLFRTLV